MKAILLYAPLLGQYAYRLGSVPVNRGKRGKAIAKMLADVKKGEALPGQLVIYSQGTRLAPGVKRPYKVGTAVLYEQMREVEAASEALLDEVGFVRPVEEAS